MASDKKTFGERMAAGKAKTGKKKADEPKRKLPTRKRAKRPTGFVYKNNQKDS